MSRFKKTPWGDKILLEKPIFLTRHRFIARVLEKPDGTKYIEISKFGPKPEGQGRYSQVLRLFQEKHWLNLRNIIENDAARRIGWDFKDTITRSDVAVIERLTRNLTKAEEKGRKRAQREKELRDINKRLMEELSIFRYAYLKSQVPTYKRALAEFKRLVRDQKTEAVYQKFFEKNAWLLGLEYIRAKPQEQAGSEDIPDFLMERFDGYCDIIELKRPSHPLFIEEGGKSKQSKELKNAISEVMDYIDYYSEQYSYELVHHDQNVYKPVAKIIIGSSLSDDHKKKLRQHNSYLHRIVILTYDEVAQSAEQVIKFYRELPMGESVKLLA